MPKEIKEKMKYQKINPTKNEEYQIAYDDKCLVIKSGKNKVWISKAMANWISRNFASKTEIQLKSWVKNYIYREIIKNQGKFLFQQRHFMTTGDLLAGIIYFPFYIIWKIITFPFRIKIFN